MFNASPLMQSLRRLDIRKDFALVVFYLLWILVYVYISTIPFSKQAQQTALSKFHLTLRPFERWAAAQFIPSMYNFHNEFYWSLEPLNGAVTPESPIAGRLTVNHYPLRMIVFTVNRRNAVMQRPIYVYLRSAYRGRERVTSYLLTTTPQNIQAQFLNAYEHVTF
jgi:hypothetical protein